MAVDFSPTGLAAAAGVDPWTLREQVRSGDPAALEAGVARLRRAASQAAEAAELGGRADQELAAGFGNDGVAVFDAAASTRAGAVLLADRGEKIDEVARVLLDVAAALSAAAVVVGRRVTALDAELSHIVGRYHGVQVDSPDPAAVAAAEQQFLRLAVEAVRTGGTQVQAELDAYDALLVNRTARLAGLGYGTPRSAVGDSTAPLAMGVGSADLEPIGEVLGALGESVIENPDAVIGMLAGIGLVLAGSGLVAGGGAVTAGSGGLAIPVGGPAVAGGWSLLGIGGALLAASANEIGKGAADRLNEPADGAGAGAGGTGGAAEHTRPSRAPDPAAEPAGVPERPNPNDSVEQVRGLQRQQESASILARAGYDVEQLPKSTASGVKNPDYRIEGEIFDNYAPMRESARNIASQVAHKIEDKQTERVVLNLADTPVDAEQMREQLRTWPVEGLKEVIAIDGSGQISHIYP